MNFHSEVSLLTISSSVLLYLLQLFLCLFLNQSANTSDDIPYDLNGKNTVLYNCTLFYD